MVDYRGCLIAWLSTEPNNPDMVVSSVVSASYTDIDITDDEIFATVFDHDVKVDMTITVQTARLTTSQQKLAIDSDMLVWHWGIPLNKTKRTVQCTTQHSVRNIANLTLVHKLCTNNCILQYCCLNHTIFTDTMFARTQSRCGNKCVQIFSSNFRRLCTYPMKM